MYGRYSEIYSRWCDCYDFENIEVQTIEKYIDLIGKDVIDIGCGTGRFLFRVLPYVKSVTGIDNDEFSIAVLNNNLSRKYGFYASKATIICSSIEDAIIPPESMDVAFFSWSLYALSEKQMEQAVQKIFHLLRTNGKLIILQPTGGEFETVMRLFFREHEDEDEYKECIKNMNRIFPPFFHAIAADKIVSHFTVSDLDEFCEVVKMFAITEGGCDANELDHICLDILNEPMAFYKNGEHYSLEDEVSLFVYEKKAVQFK